MSHVKTTKLDVQEGKGWWERILCVGDGIINISPKAFGKHCRQPHVKERATCKTTFTLPSPPPPPSSIHLLLLLLLPLSAQFYAILTHLLVTDCRAPHTSSLSLLLLVRDDERENMEIRWVSPQIQATYEKHAVLCFNPPMFSYSQVYNEKYHE